jgi:hypothetical protein
VLAVQGSIASVIGGAPAAAVVFTREVNARTAADPAVRELEAQLAACADDAAGASLRVKLSATQAAVRSDKLGEVAAEFEAVHNVERARQVGSVHSIIPAAQLRPSIVAAVERGMARTVDALGHWVCSAPTGLNNPKLNRPGWVINIADAARRGHAEPPRSAI